MIDNQSRDQPGSDTDPSRELTRQLADCRQQLSQVQTTLVEAQRVLTLNHQLESERTRVLAAERTLNELKSNFVTLASHEFRTPMMTILSSASLIGHYTGPADGDKRERHVQRIKVAVGSLTAMLTDFLAISQMDQATVTNNPQPLDLPAFCADVISQTETLAKPRQRFHYQHLTQETIGLIDEQLLKPVLLNLLANASKYSAEDTEVRLTSAVTSNGLTLTVSDQGIGIPEVDQNKLFISFFRARNAIHIQGAGLGLYLVKRYVDLLGGAVTFTSEPGRGPRSPFNCP